jgi:hypothetical protein
MNKKILSFKMWEDAAANSVASGGVDMAPNAMGKKALLKRKKKNEKARVKHDARPGGDWESRAKLQRNVRSDMWKAVGKKLKRK